MIDPSGSTAWTYDQHGRVTSKTQQTNNLTLVTRLAYDGAGRLASITYPSGKAVAVHYDAAGNVSGLGTGRPKETRLALLKDINTRVAAAAGVSPDDMLITLYEVPGENISFGQGEAQRAKAVAPG